MRERGVGNAECCIFPTVASQSAATGEPSRVPIRPIPWKPRLARPQGAPMTIALTAVWVLGSFTLVMAALFAATAED